MARQALSGTRRRRTPLVGLLLGTALAAYGCGTMGVGYSVTEAAGTSLSTSEPAGEQRLQLEAEYDSAIHELVLQFGRPEYIHIIDRENLYLFYTALDRVAVVERLMIPPGKVRIYERTPGFLLKLLPQTAIDQVLAERERSARANRADARKTRRTSEPTAPQRARTSPAARAPHSGQAGVQFSDFDSKQIVERLRTPLSAADPGVTGWRHAQLADGTPKQIASANRIRYQVGAATVSLASPIESDARTPSDPTRYGVYRLNQAVYGTRGDAVDTHVAPLIARVAADPTGRTRISQRVAGRTITVARDPARGYLVYAIAAR